MPWLSRSYVNRQRSSTLIELAIVVVLSAVAFAGALWVSNSVFDRVPHTEDEAAFLFQAQTIASGNLVADEPEHPRFFSIPFIIVRDGMWFGKYPLGFPMVLSLGVLVAQPWLVNASLAALCVPAIYVLTRRLYGSITAMFAAGLLVASPFFLLQAGSLLSHIASLFWSLLFLALFPAARSRRGYPLALATGVAIGMLFLSRPLTAVGIALPYLAWSLITMVKQRKIARSYVIMAAGALPFVALFLGYNLLTTGSAFHTAYELWWPFDRLGFGPDIGVNGHDLDDGLRNTKVNATALASFLFGWPGRFSLVPACVAVGVSLITVLARRFRKRATRSAAPQMDQLSREAWDLILASVALSLVAIHILYWTPGQMYGPRYFMETIGPLVMLSARGIMRVSDTLALLLERRAPRVGYPHVAGNATMLLVVLALTSYTYTRWVPQEFERFRDWNAINGDGVAVVQAAGLDNALVFVDRDSWVDYAPFFAQNVPALDSEIVYASDRGPVENRVLMELYPAREFYRYANGQLSPLPAPN